MWPALKPAKGSAFSNQTKETRAQQPGPDPVRQQERSTVSPYRTEQVDLNGASGEMLGYLHGQRRRRSREEPTLPLRGHSTYRGVIPQLGRRHQLELAGLEWQTMGGERSAGKKVLCGVNSLSSGRVSFRVAELSLV